MEVNRETILISKVVDRCETPAEWSELDTLAGNDSALWSRLRTMLRDDADLRAAVASAVAVADAVAVVPPLPVARVPWWSLGGWMAAAALAVLWLAGAPLPSTGTSPGGMSPGNGRAEFQAADPADDGHGREQRTALGELPPVLVRSQPTEDGSA